MNKLLNIKILSLFLCLTLVLSCGSKDKKKPSAENSYIKAIKKLKDKNYSGAATDFEGINDEYPLSKWGIKAQPMAAYSFYKEKKYDDVIRITNDFNLNNPSNQEVAYMQYLKALSYYEQMNNITRAQDNANLASLSFRELINKFPDSKYIEDSINKLSLVNEHIAGAKMSVGRYQLINGNYVGAIKNFQEVISRYSTTKQSPEAYFRIFESYKKIGLNQEAQNYLQDLKRYYPNNEFLNN
jgi:outer membrane protein assembly factor BamD